MLWYSKGLCLPVYLLMRSLILGDTLPPLLLLLILVLLLMVLSVFTRIRSTEIEMNLLS